MNKYTVKFKVNNDRRGASLKMYHAEADSTKFQDSNLQLNQIMNKEDLRKALRTQFAFILDEIVEKLSKDIENQEERVAQIRIKEVNRTSNLRKAMKKQSKQQEKTRKNIPMKKARPVIKMKKAK